MDVDLNPLRCHYIKKYLIGRELENEMDQLSKPDGLSLLGNPFSQPVNPSPTSIPLLKYIFNRFIITFPLLTSSPPSFWSDKLQVFVNDFLSRNLSSSIDQDELTKRKALIIKLQKHMTILLSSGFKMVQDEDVIRVNVNDLKQYTRKHSTNTHKLHINIVTIRAHQKKSLLHHKHDDEFIIHSKLTNQARSEDIYVARSYNDFMALSNQLRLEFTDDDIPSPPQKDKSSNSTLFREKNRLTLRAYLKDLLNLSSAIANSTTLQSFLLSNPTALSDEEIKDIHKRLAHDAMKVESKNSFKREMDERAAEVMESVKQFKSDISSKNGFKRMFSLIKDNQTIETLPSQYSKVVEWAKISFASTLYSTFISSDTSSETFSGLKSIHSLMPYFVLRGILKISNPMAMVRGVIDLFLAQPFGQKSVLQRMFSASIYEEIKQLEDDVDLVKERIQNQEIISKIAHFVASPFEVHNYCKEEADKLETHVLNVVLKGDEISSASLGMVQRSYSSFIDKDSDEDEDMSSLFFQLDHLLKLQLKLKERHQMIEMIFEGVTAELLKDMVTIFYTPLAQVYKAANISDALYDLQAFITDLIDVVERVEEEQQQHSNPINAVHIFVDLVIRHQNQFYSFVHNVHSKGDALFDSFGEWIEGCYDFLRDGVDADKKMDLEFILPIGETERRWIMEEADKTIEYNYQKKLQYEERMMRRVREGQEEEEGDEKGETDETEAGQWVAGLVGSLGVDEVLTTEQMRIGEMITPQEVRDNHYMTEQANFSCPTCQAKFTRKQHVYRHMRTHTGEKPYECEICNESFSRSDLLSRHQSKCHAGHPLIPKKGQRLNRKLQVNVLAQTQQSKQEKESEKEHLYREEELQQKSQQSQPTLDLGSVAYNPESIGFSNVASQTEAVWSNFFNNQSSVDVDSFKHVYESQLGNDGADRSGYINTAGLPHTPLEFKLPMSPNSANSANPVSRGDRRQPDTSKLPFDGVDMQQLLNSLGVDDGREIDGGDGRQDRDSISTHNTSSKNDLSMHDLWSQYLSVPMSANATEEREQEQMQTQTQPQPQPPPQQEQSNEIAHTAKNDFALAAAHKGMNDVSSLKLNQPPAQKGKVKGNESRTVLHRQQQSLSDQYRLPMLSGPPRASEAAGEDLKEYEQAVLSRQVPQLNFNTRFLRYRRDNKGDEVDDVKPISNIYSHSQPYLASYYPALSQPNHSIKRDLSTPYLPDDSKRYAFSLPTPLSPPEASTDAYTRLNEQLALRI
ncbi:hypothetical protein E3P81_02604 [Wallemia ichthyophaga]|nr:hypothetical protein E3P97_02675 [Wallemia ichthyophaga]TIB31259.1 hypothetical protein E3P85_02328 [Wallemia ichthyophaga]TIB45745.1 hypothetical protein E3P82_02603 [Wallemia ichthyophaga]TIB49176.1 hypothetical protein E3P81_02604 [Wallemia ichthyophaga]TIB52333.1 hypothetical protein E3P80_02605 [Wallemia ichthyophaga]